MATPADPDQEAKYEDVEPVEGPVVETDVPANPDAAMVVVLGAGVVLTTAGALAWRSTRS